MSGCTGPGSNTGGVGNLYGTVYNIYYSPISNADVVVDSTSTKSLSNGTYSFINLPSGNRKIKISTNSHTPAYRQVTYSGGTSANAGIAFLANLDSKVTPITLAGGIATNTNGSIKIVFPLNSINDNVILTSVPMIAAPYDPPGGDQFVSYVVYAKPENATLTPSAELSVPNLTGITTQDVSFYRFNSDTLGWEYFGTGHGSIDATSPIKVLTPYMGWIAAIMPITPPPGTISGTVKNSTFPNDPISGANVWTNTSYAVTNDQGSYTLYYVPSGKATVEASAVNYSPKTTSNVPVTSETTTSLNILLDAVPQGNITGIVRDNTPGYVENARVVESNGGGVAYSDGYGRYTIYNVSSLYPTDVTAYSAGHISSTESSVSVPAGGSTTVDFLLLYTGTVQTYNFTFESSEEGWTGTGFWHRQDTSQISSWNSPNRLTDYFSVSHGTGLLNKKVDLPDDGQIPVAHGGNHCFWYGKAAPSSIEASYIEVHLSTDIEEGSGGYSATRYSGTLESPALDLIGYSYGKLSFWTWWEIEGQDPAKGLDTMQILVNKNSESLWTSLGYLNPFEDPVRLGDKNPKSYTSGGYYQPGIWVQHNFNLSNYAGSIIKIRFVFDTGDNAYNGYRGWFIDDVQVANEQFGISSFGNIRPYIIRLPRN